MKYVLIAVTLFFTCHSAPIVMKQPEKSKEQEGTQDLDWRGKLHYDHYLTEVMTELEKDEDFGKRLKEMRKNSSLKTEDLATQLTFAKHSVRSRLDELKRLELKRLSELERRLDILKAQRGDKDVPEEIRQMIQRDHLDHQNPSTFEINDLQKLIKRAISDLHALDEKQRELFKKHEMRKVIEHKRKMKHIKDEAKRKAEEQKWEESQQRHNKHEKIHTPGSEAQLKEVWEKEDKLDPNDFDSLAFFKMHDLDGDGELDEKEIESLFQPELDKAYDPNNPDDDMSGRYESMMEMREKILNKIDTNHDLRISYQELKNWTKSPEFSKDEGFKLPEEDKGRYYNEDDMKDYEREYDREHPDLMDDDLGDHHETKPHDGKTLEMKIPHHEDGNKKDLNVGSHHEIKPDDGKTLKMKIPAHDDVPKKDPNRKVVGKQVPDHM